MAEQKTNRVTTVEILGSEYRLVGEDELYLKQLAQYVDNQLRACSEEEMVYSSGRLGILTCLNIADQFYKLKEEYKKLLFLSLDSITRLINRIDKILGDTEQNDTSLIKSIEPTEVNSIKK